MNSNNNPASKGFGGEIPYGSLTDTFQLNGYTNVEVGQIVLGTNGASYILLQGCAGLTNGMAVLFDQNYTTILALTGANVGTNYKTMAVYVGSTSSPANSTNQAGYFMLTGNANVLATGVTFQAPLYMSATPGVLSPTVTLATDVTGYYCYTNPVLGYSGVFTPMPVIPGGTPSTAIVSQGSPFAGGTPNGIVYVDATGKLQTLPNFSFDSTTNKFTLSGPGSMMDPISVLVSDPALAAFYQANDGHNAAIAPANTGRIRYNAVTQGFEESVNGTAWAPLGSGGLFVGTGVQAGSNYVTTYTPSTPTLAAGLEIVFFPNASSVGADTLNTVAILKDSPTGLVALAANDLVAGGSYNLIYNGTNWVLQSSSSAGTYQTTQTLVAGANVVTHNLASATVSVQLIDTVTNDLIFAKLSNFTVNTCTVTVLNGIPNVLVTVQS